MGDQPDQSLETIFDIFYFISHGADPWKSLAVENIRFYMGTNAFSNL